MLLKELEKLLTNRLNIADGGQVTFRGRMQNLQRLKFPAGINTGRGRRVDYSWSEIFQIAIAFDLIDAGLTQDVATKLITANRDGIAFGISAFSISLMESGILKDWVAESRVPDGHNAYLICVVNSLRQIKNAPHDYGSYITFVGEDEVLKDGELNQQIITGGRIVLNLGQLILFVLNFVSFKMEQGSDETIASFETWLNKIKLEWRKK